MTHYYDRSHSDTASLRCRAKHLFPSGKRDYRCPADIRHSKAIHRVRIAYSPQIIIASDNLHLTRALPAHLLSVLFICIGITCLIVHILHQRTRRNLWLTSPPGSIAAIASLTSRSGFGELLLPYDDVSRMKSNLAGLTFRLDRRTGAILAEEDFDMMDAADNTALLGLKKGYSTSPLSRTSFKEKTEPDSP